MFVKISEQPSLYDNLENESIPNLLEYINREDHKIADAVQKALPAIEKLVEGIVPRMKKGGRIIYVGAGTSGRLGVLDASEIPPTYGMEPGWVIGIIAGGDHALRNPVEKAEDSKEQAIADIKALDLKPLDTVVGIAASGTTPYVISAVEYARSIGCLTAGITSNPEAPLSQAAEIAIETVVGPEFVTGSSRMKSGTAQKLVLNMISTVAMIKIGRVKGNRMVNMQLSNAKLVDRGTRMVMDEIGVDYDEAQRLLLLHGSVNNVILACKKG